MKINFSNEAFIPVEKSIFLAGPTKRNSCFDLSWRKDACNIIESYNFDGTVYVPEFSEGIMKPDLTEQAGWERQGLFTAKAIAFWFPRQLPDMPGLTTNIEYGMWLTRKPDSCLIGCPPWAEKMSYIKWLWYQEKPEASFYTSLEDLLKAAVEKANN